MKYTFGLLALAGLVIPTPVERRQDLDLDGYNNIPNATAVAAPDGVTAVQATTAAYNPSAAASSAVDAAATILTVSSDAASPTGSFEKRGTTYPINTAPGTTNGCSTLEPVGNGPVTSPDTPQDFLANPVYSTAANNAKTPNGYSAVFTNSHASAADPSYLTYTTKGMTSYDPSICAAYCTALAGCNSFNIYYERDPGYVTSDTCTNPPSTVWLKCALFGAHLTPSSATNIGQFRRIFETAIAGSNAYTRSSPSAIPGFQGPVGLGNAVINAPLSWLGTQSFPTTQPYDPSVCAAACLATTQTNQGKQPSSGLYDTCRFFTAYVLYKNGQKGVFTCSYYSLAWDPSYATNTGTTSGTDTYTIGFSFSYTLNPVYGTPGTGLNFYAYNNPNNLGLPSGYAYPTLSPFQGTNYIASGIFNEKFNDINYGGCLSQIADQTLPQCLTQIAIAFKGFFIAPTAGTYTFATPYPIDDEWYMYHGDTALSGWGLDNYDSHAIWTQSSSYSITLTKGYILPVLFLWANTDGPGQIVFQITMPDGSVVTDTTGLFTPVNPTNNPFVFSS